MLGSIQKQRRQEGIGGWSLKCLRLFLFTTFVYKRLVGGIKKICLRSDWMLSLLEEKMYLFQKVGKPELGFPNHESCL